MTTPSAGTSITTGADQYSYSNTNWSTVTPATNPGVVALGAMAYDPATTQTIMYANTGATWAWNGTNWTEVATTGPAARTGAALAYDPAVGTSGEVVLFGGEVGATYYNDTWAWNGTAWAQIADSGDAGCTTTCTSSPSGRDLAALAFDGTTASGQLVLFGGWNGTTYDADTWAWNTTTSAWAQLSPTASPTARYSATLAYDPAMGTGGQLVLFGGASSTSTSLSDTWAWNGTTWAQLYPAASPLGRDYGTMAYDTVTAQLVLFGGNWAATGVGNDTWDWTGTTWASLAPSTSPPVRQQAAMAYDAATDQMVLYGGAGLSDTWLIGPPVTAVSPVSGPRPGAAPSPSPAPASAPAAPSTLAPPPAPMSPSSRPAPSRSRPRRTARARSTSP